MDNFDLIPLTKGQFTKVSPHRFDKLNDFKWAAQWNPRTNSFYAKRNELINGIRQTILMHRQILGLDYGDRRNGDHQNHDTLDNTDENLRIATTLQNRWNSRVRRNNTSGYVGVFYLKRCDFWFSMITVDGKSIYLGSRRTPDAAYRELYVPAAIKYHGEFACL